MHFAPVFKTNASLLLLRPHVLRSASEVFEALPAQAAPVAFAEFSSCRLGELDFGAPATRQGCPTNELPAAPFAVHRPGEGEEDTSLGQRIHVSSCYFDGPGRRTEVAY